MAAASTPTTPLPIRGTGRPLSRKQLAALALFAVTALLSAFLIFWVEPLFAKMVLPLLGGSPAVWNTCLMFFQSALLLGYLYAHLGTRLLTLRRQALLHMALLALALLALPVVVPSGWTPPTSGNVIPWLLLVLTVGLGAPFLMLSATAPLVQRWFASLDHPGADNPYVLYAASNAGSLLGLLAFPVLLEPNLRLIEQARIWSTGFVAFVLFTTACAALVWRGRMASRRPPPEAALDRAPPGAARPELRDRLLWVALAFVPSSLLLGVTTYLSTDVAAAPFLWIVPLALYLVTFIIVFAKRHHAPSRPVAYVQALLLAVLIVAVFWGAELDLRWAYPLHLGVFFLTALMLHGRLAVSRPAPAHLTEFYLWIAVGGALGGVFNALLAPLIFDSVIEYELMLVIAAFLLPSWRGIGGTGLERVQAVAISLIPFLLLAVAAGYELAYQSVAGVRVVWLVSAAVVAILLAQRSSAKLYGIGVTAIALGGALLFRAPDEVVYRGRSFFGTYRVERVGSDTHVLMHGTTVHGAQFVGGDRELEQLTYYHPNGPVGQTFAALGDRLQNRRIAVVGLGAGAVLCYGSAGQEWSYFEIDPLVERIARTPEYFTYLSRCPVDARVVIGDARLTLAREPAGSYSLLVLDAFSSDAIPVHLLTREAFQLYGSLLEPGGLLLIHISNRHLRLEPIVGALARASGLVGIFADHVASDSTEEKLLEYSSDWVLLARTTEDLGPLARDPRWQSLTTGAGHRVWTDDYSDVFSVLRW